MCEKCVDLDKKIGYFRVLAVRLMDSSTIEAARKLIEEMQAQKAALHPEQQN